MSHGGGHDTRSHALPPCHTPATPPHTDWLIPAMPSASPTGVFPSLDQLASLLSALQQQPSCLSAAAAAPGQAATMREGFVVGVV